MISLVAKGAVLGFSVAAPLGPIGLLCIQRTLIFGRKAGFLSGLGAATADLLCAGVTGFGLTAVLLMAGRLDGLLQAAGGAYLFWLGVRIWKSRESDQAEASSGHSSPGKLYGSLLLLTLANPMTWMSFAGAFAGLGGRAAGSTYLSGVAFMTGVFLGSAFWWFLLSLITDRLRLRLRIGSLVWINRVSAVVIMGLGAWSLLALAIRS